MSNYYSTLHKFISLLFLQVIFYSLEQSSCLITFEDENAYLLHKEEDWLLQQALLEEQEGNDDYFVSF